MKKRVQSAIAVLLCVPALLLSGCSGTTQAQTTPQPIESSAQPTAEPTAAPTAEPTPEPTVEPTPGVQQNLYEQFLGGTGLVYNDRFQVSKWDWAEETKLLADGQGYTLREFVEALTAPSYDAERRRSLSQVRYAYLDCGGDGVPELALEIISTDEWEDEVIIQAVIKELDGSLQLCWFGETYYRSYEALSGSRGQVGSYGSSGYASNYYATGAIDKDGVYHLLYAIDDEYGFGTLYPDINPVSAAAAAYEEELPTDYLLEIVTIYDLNTGAETVYYGADPEDDELVQTIFAEAGVPLTSAEALEQLYADQLQAMGLTESSQEPDFQLVDYAATGLDLVLKYGANPIFVSDIEEFAASIGSDRTLVLAPGTYNLTQWLKAYLDELTPYDIEDDSEHNTPGIHYEGWNGELEFVLCGISGLRIISQESETPAVIVSEPRYFHVMSLHNCWYVDFVSIIMGHTEEQGLCSGDVLGVSGSYSVYAIDCDLYGCGAYGLYADSSNNVQLRNCVIHDCSYGCAEIFDGSSVTFSDCTFRDCREYDMFMVMNSSAEFFRCQFQNLNGNMVYMNENAYASFSDCSYDKASLDSLNAYTGPGHLTLDD